MAAMVVLGLGEVAVSYVAFYFIVVGLDIYSDEAVLRCTNAMFECVFDERDEYHGRYKSLAFLVNKDVEFDVHVCSHSDSHKAHIVADELHFFRNAYKPFLVVVKHMS